MSSEEKEEKVISMIKEEFEPFFITERMKLIILALRLRFKRIRNSER